MRKVFADHFTLTIDLSLRCHHCDVGAFICICESNVNDLVTSFNFSLLVADGNLLESVERRVKILLNFFRIFWIGLCRWYYVFDERLILFATHTIHI